MAIEWAADPEEGVGGRSRFELGDIVWVKFPLWLPWPAHNHAIMEENYSVYTLGWEEIRDETDGLCSRALPRVL